MQFNKYPKYFRLVIIISSVMFVLASVGTIMMYIKPDKSVPIFSESSPEMTVVAQSEYSIPEEDWKVKNAAELEAAQKAVEEAKARYQTAEDERTALASELGIAEEQLDKARADLESKELPELDLTVFREKYEEKGELVTLDYEYEYLSKATDNGNKLILWDTKEFLYRIRGTMKLGVNLSFISDGLIIDDMNKIITLTIPAAYVIANDPDESNVERYDIKTGWLGSNPVTDEDLLNAFTTINTDLEKRVAQVMAILPVYIDLLVLENTKIL